MKEWGFQNIRLAEKYTQLHVGTEEVKVEIRDYQMNLNWNASWSSWEQFMGDQDVQKLISDSHERILKAGKGTSKGK